tara:strand:- start:1015 stop:1446 length:432 start_codon:yes stop_codon:yes gene_type:complete
MSIANWFLAHKRMDDDAEIDYWCGQLAMTLSSDGWSANVTAGRDDYESRARALGGWKAWCRDVARARTFDGDMLFHGIVVPVSGVDEKPTVGKATAQLVQGFINAQKHTYAWCPVSGSFRHILALHETNEDDYKQWAWLELQE